MIQKAENVAHLYVKTWSPGDAAGTRYRFFTSYSADYENWSAALYTALGLKEANTWLNGYISGLRRYRKLTPIVTPKASY